MIIIINNSTETHNHHHYQTKWWSVAIDVGFVSTRAISIFRTEKLYLYTNAKTVVKNLTNHFIDRHIKTQIVVMNKHKKCSLKQRQWCIICTCTQASTTTGWSQLPERSKPWLKRVFSGFRLALNHKFYVLMVFILLWRTAIIMEWSSPSFYSKFIMPFTSLIEWIWKEILKPPTKKVNVFPAISFKTE